MSLIVASNCPKTAARAREYLQRQTVSVQFICYRQFDVSLCLLFSVSYFFLLRFAALVVDRLCIYVFSIFIVGGTCGILLSAPHLIA